MKRAYIVGVGVVVSGSGGGDRIGGKWDEVRWGQCGGEKKEKGGGEREEMMMIINKKKWANKKRIVRLLYAKDVFVLS